MPARTRRRRSASLSRYRACWHWQRRASRHWPRAAPPAGARLALLGGAGFARSLAVGVAAATGVLKPLGALLGVGLSSGLALEYPLGLGLAVGAMIFVVSHEVIPEAYRNGYQTPATLGLMAGFVLMMVLDTAPS